MKIVPVISFFFGIGFLAVWEGKSPATARDIAIATLSLACLFSVGMQDLIELIRRLRK